jgi:TatD DNase family protein
MWIDTHCHLDAGEFGGGQQALSAAAAQSGVAMIVIPAIAAFNFGRVAELARQYPNCAYALGIHPLLTPQAEDGDLDALQRAIELALDDPRFVAIGEIGLDYFVPELQQGALRDKQERFFAAQLKLARQYDLPVLLHVRRAQDIVLKYLRRQPVRGGIAHAFNGSFQQAQRFIDLGLKLGFGGAMTFSRALQIRRLAGELPLQALVLETDAPDISPAWLHPAVNTPQQIPRIGAVLAELRGLTPEAVAQASSANACAAMPRLAALLGRAG